MPVTLPYKLQVFLSHETRDALKSAAEKHHTTLQDLVEMWLEARLREEEVGTPAAAHRPSQPVLKET